MKTRRVPDPPVDLLNVRGDGPSADAARTATEAIHQTWTLIRDAARDPEVDLKELTRVGDAALKKGLKAADSAAERIRAQIGHIDGQIKERTQPTMTPQMATEIRAMVREDPKRAATLARSDPRMAGAILSGPAALCGLDARQYEQVREAAVLAHASEQAAQRKEAELALSAVERAGTRALADLTKKLGEWDEAKPAQIAKLMEVAR
ncbi:hypothetical protein [Altererythrobacter lutimaris]|uniref:Uncharacterized protein n=1 Tax=Altererythrobacter lutimaris TaxID=2743979 RepID=A0A850H9A2_9SPHN|nr:hypothetical protein [Altererythrobacter lutimaris]NVE95894.1 hypothetical protein [Altererythrobacter lutimaris]